MMSNRKDKIATSFGGNVENYDRLADLQRETAAKLAAYLPDMEKPKVLEIGCGTGFLTAHLFEKYPDADYTITDLSPDMVQACRNKFADKQAEFRVMDGEDLRTNKTFDLIVSGMTIQWFADPAYGLKNLARNLNPGGALYYSTLGPDCFREWRETLQAINAPQGTLQNPPLPGIFQEEHLTRQYDDAMTFLKALKVIGAGLPRNGYATLLPATLKKACSYFDENYQGAMTWHIVYGKIEL